MKPLLLCLVTLPVLAACGSSSTDGEPASSPPTETVFDPLLEQRDKVKDVADTLPQERKANLDQAIESDTQ